jgi:hypothetical protein
MPDNEIKADLNGDGLEDVAFLLTQDGGGSGTFYYVVVALKAGTGYKGTNAIFLGDRIAPQKTEIHNGELVVNCAERRPSEPMTVQPSVGVAKYLKIKDDRLVEVLSKLTCASSRLMKRLILGSVMALFLMDGPAAAECVYQGVLYSEGARVCMHRTMFMCRGERWVRTAERCWERYFTQASPLQQAGQEKARGGCPGPGGKVQANPGRV